MIRVNLLSFETRLQQTRKGPNFWAGVTFGSLAAILLSTFLFQVKTHRTLKRDTNELQGYLNLYDPILKKMDELENDKKTLEAKRGVIQLLEHERLWYPPFFDQLMELLPGNVWLTNLTTTVTPGQRMLVNVTAYAFDSFSIADLINNFEKAGNYPRVDLGPVASSMQGQYTVYQFTVTAEYQPHVAKG